MNEQKEIKSILEDIFGPIVPTCRWCGTPVDEGQEYCSEDCRKGAEHYRTYSVEPEREG